MTGWRALTQNIRDETWAKKACNPTRLFIVVDNTTTQINRGQRNRAIAHNVSAQSRQTFKVNILAKVCTFVFLCLYS